MREYEWYQNLADEACAMPGSFAVFALGLEGEQWAPLVAEYLDLCDDEHSSLQEKFLHALIRKMCIRDSSIAQCNRQIAMTTAIVLIATGCC